MALTPAPSARDLTRPALKALLWPRRLTFAGLWVERLAQAFWLFWVLLLVGFAALAFGLHQIGPLWGLRLWLSALSLGLLGAFCWGLWAFRRPTQAEAWARLDQSLPGRPIAALIDTPAIGAEDPAAQAVWQAHQARMAARLLGAKPVAPDLRLSSRDPYGLRYMALTSAVMAGIFGSLWRVADLSAMGAGPAQAISATAWEAWARPPAYTGKPTVYLNDMPEGALDLPVGTKIQIRLYGTDPGYRLHQTIAQTPTEPPADAAALPQDLGAMSEWMLEQSGRLAIEGSGGRAWEIFAIPDLAPDIAPEGAIKREADGGFKQAFTASDDYAVVSGKMSIKLDLDRVMRLHGLALDPEPMEDISLDLPMPLRGKKDNIKEVLTDDLSKSLLANMPVRLQLSARDHAGGEGLSPEVATHLPAKRFFDPYAAAVAEMRRDLMWNRDHLPRVREILKAIAYLPETYPRGQRPAKHLRVLLREMDAVTRPALTLELRDHFTEELWQIAEGFEKGDLNSAQERLARAQDQLEEAIRNGASPEEIDQLMQEMQQAMRDYTRELARKSQQDPQGQEGGGGAGGQEITADQLQQMLDEIEQLMKEGKTAEAMQRMEQLRQLMENLQVQQGQGGGEGEGEGEGGRALRELGEGLKDQQGLSDDAYRDMQRGRGGRGREQPGPEGESGGESGRADADSLAQRQGALRERLDDLQSRRLPGDGRERGEAGRQALDGAEEAMRQAEEALREGDLSGALDHQAEAMQRMREGLRNFGDALAEERRNAGEPPEGRQDRQGESGGRPGTDPLGRETGQGARIGSDQSLAENAPDSRARDLLDEIRRRAGEAGRPESELDYLKRLLELF